MNKLTKTLAATAATVATVFGMTACTSAADQANRNLSKAAENFEVPRRIVGINTIKGEVLWSVEGFCSYETPDSKTVEAICLTDRAKGTVERTTMHLSDNVTFVSTQMDGVQVNMFHPRVIFRPENIIPNFDLSTSSSFKAGATN